MKKDLIVFFLVCLCGTFLFSAEKKEEIPLTVKELPKEVSYLEPNTGIVFPAELAGFHKLSVVENANPVYGTVIRYFGPAGESADIYIYSNNTAGASVTEKELAVQYEETRKALLARSGKMNEKGIPAKEDITGVTEKVFKSPDGGSAVYSCSFFCRVGDEPVHSDLLMLRFARKGEKVMPENTDAYAKFVKIRLTRPSEIPGGEKISEQFLQKLLLLMNVSRGNAK